MCPPGLFACGTQEESAYRWITKFYFNAQIDDTLKE
jgi:hypothetical protein